MLEREPMSAHEAKKLIRDILRVGVVTFVDPHALDALADDGRRSQRVTGWRRGRTGVREWSLALSRTDWAYLPHRRV
jgi:hypothetical protein